MITLLALAAAALGPDDGGSARALANLASYISDSDYPAAAIRAGEQGTVGFMLDVRPDGLVSDCHILMSSGSASLDETTCRIMRERPRFSPAHDRHGNPVADHFKARVRWVLPATTELDLTSYVSSADYPAHAIPRAQVGRIEVELFLARDGSVARCVVSEAGGNTALAARTCALLQERVRLMVGNAPAVPDVLDGYVDWASAAP